MSSIIKNDKVVYVEPNLVHDFTSYNSVNNGEVFKSVSLEDMCIVVGLEVEIKGRTYATSHVANDNNVTRMLWQSSQNGNKVSFMRGTKIPTTNNGDVYSFTTNYTDIHLFDLEEDGTTEMFGIKSIDISYSNFMVPEVTINFVDVRGVSLFAQEEMRHNLSNKDMGGLVNNDIEGSFFKCFFTFPYPRFILYVKGFYGQMVSYELTCSDFRSAFDSNSGNFNVTAKFVGYAFSFLGDVMVNALASAPYSEYIGKKYWEDNAKKGGRFVVRDRNGVNDIPMKKLGEICESYRDIQMHVANEIKEKGYAGMAKELNNYTDEQVKTLEATDLEPLKETYWSIIDRLNNIKNLIEASDESQEEGDKVIQPDGTHSYAFITDNKRGDLSLSETEGKELAELISNFNKTIRDDKNYSNYEPIKNWLENGHKLCLTEYKDYTKILLENDKVNPKIVDDEDLRNAIDEVAGHTIQGQKRTYTQAWSDGVGASNVYIYQDYGLDKILSRDTAIKAKNEEFATNMKKDIENNALNREFYKYFKFDPTLENITKIIMAHVETFVKMVSTCANNIIGMQSQRSIGNLGIKDISNFPDVLPNNVNAASPDTIVAPFPKVVHVIEEEGAGRRTEDAWLDEIQGIDKSKFEEIKLVEGILAGISKLSEEINKSLEEYKENSNKKEKSYTTYPITYFDLFTGENDLLWGNINTLDINDLFARFCIRAFSVMATRNGLGVSANVYGSLDAKNFLDKYAKEASVGPLPEMLESITTDQIINFLKDTGQKIDKSKSYRKIQIIKNVDSENYKLVIGSYGNKRNIFPTRNWRFGDMYNIADEKTGLKSKKFTNYITTTCTEKSGKDLSSETVEILYDPINYFKASLINLENSDEEKENGVVSKIFKNIPLNKDIQNISNNSHCSSMWLNKQLYQVNMKDAIVFDSDGVVYNTDEYSLDFMNIFMDESFLEKNEFDRAVEFIKTVFPQTNEIDLSLEDPSCKYYMKCELLRYGAHLLEKEGKNTVRPTLYAYLKEYFTEWAKNEYPKIEETYKLKIPKEKTIGGLIEKCWEQRGDENALGNTLKDFLKEEYRIIFDKIYNIKSSSDKKSGGVYLQPKICDEMTEIMKDFFQVVGLCIKSKFNCSNGVYESSSFRNPYLSESNLRGYFEGMLTILKRDLKPNKDGNQYNTSISMSTDPVDIKVGVYMYLKMLYDKWIAANTQDEFYKLERLFDGKDPTFHFIDSVYTKIGKTMYLNLSTLVERVHQSQTANGYTLLSMLSGLYADNKFLFLCIQNFLDMSRVDMIDKMFRPIPYLDVVEPSNRPNFIVLMPYEPSSKLDVNGADYPDDGFYLNEDESTWPEMIKGKPEDGFPIPAFGVSYGQQYQNYFKNIQVDMNAPMSTEQSIKAKFLIAGAHGDSQNKGTNLITAGQDLYTIYSNNSYTCTVTMMGCAWVQPMMYFVLQNVPMFRGSYMIVKVNHQIQPGSMITTFKGIRMAKTATRAVKSPVFVGVPDAIGSSSRSDYTSGGGVKTPGSYVANIGNDCEYAYYNPKQAIVKVPTNADAEAYCYAAYQILIGGDDGNGKNGLKPEQAKGICANLMSESSFRPYVVSVDGGDTTHGMGGGLAGFYIGSKMAQGVSLFKEVYGNAAIHEIEKWNAKVEPEWHGAQHEIPGEIYPISFEQQMQFIYKQTKVSPYNKIRSAETATEATMIWMNTFEKPGNRYNWDRWNGGRDLENVEYHRGYGNWVEAAIAKQERLQTSQSNQNSGTTNAFDELAEGLKVALTRSLRTSENYNNVEVTYTKGPGEYYYFKTVGNNQNGTNALFDCLLNTYRAWFNSISWHVGNASTPSDAKSITVRLVNSEKPLEKIDVTVLSEGGRRAAQISKKEDINESLRLSLIKYFKKQNITTANAIKSVFRSCVLSDKETLSLFDLGNEQTIEDCNSVLGENGLAETITKSSGSIEDGLGNNAYPLKKSVRAINLIVVHCTADPEGKDNDVNHIREEHKKNNKWATIGYHYVIYRDGRVINGRNVNYSGAHCEGHNSHSIGVSYVGGLQNIPNTPYKNLKAKDTRTDAQKASLKKLLTDLKSLYPNAIIRGHRDFSRKDCPSFDATSEYANI